MAPNVARTDQLLAPDHLFRPAELVGVGEQKIRLRLSDGLRAQILRLLAADKVLPVERSGHFLSIVVPSILDHEVVAIDL